MKKNGMMMVCGNSLEDIKNGVKAMEMAMRGGAVMGVGGDSLTDIKNGMAMMEQAVCGSSHLCHCGYDGFTEKSDTLYTDDEIENRLDSIYDALASLGFAEDDIDTIVDTLQNIVG